MLRPAVVAVVTVAVVVCLALPAAATPATVMQFRFTPPRYNETVWTAFKAKTLLNPPANLTSDPYSTGINTTRVAAVCAVQYSSANRTSYRLKTYASPEAAYADHAFVTHNGTCGVCSTLQDLGVYMEHHNLTAPVRECGLKGFLNKEKERQCLLDIGFTYACMQIWYDNAGNSAKECLLPCLKDLHKPYNYPNGSLNPCLQCDEDKSGPVFKKVAERTRRSSGLSSAIYRPPNTIYPVYHWYY